MVKPPRVEVRVLRVFCGEGGTEGNPLGVVLDGGAVARDDRQAMARHLGYSETVFVDDPAQGRIQIFTPEVQMKFAGHPSVGTAWILACEGYEIDALRPPAGKVPVRFEDGTPFIAGRPEWAPPFELAQHGGAAEVDALPAEGGLIYAWAWIDEEAGLVRARSFVAEAGIAEDEATGAAAVRLCASLGRPIEIHQGRGSVIHARPIEDGMVEIGGVVVED